MPKIFNMALVPSGGELVLWGIQVLLLVSWLAGAARGLRRWEPSAGTCAAVLAGAWALRLALQFVLAANGFVYFWSDDLLRYQEAYAWSRDPSLLAGEFVWLPGTAYLHGSMMRLFDDPLIGSKLMSALYNLFPLVGIFSFTLGLFGSRLLACTATLVASCWWVHVLLGSGTMTELPVAGLMLTAVGLLYLGLDARRRGSRQLCLAGSAACFALSTSLHIVAWVHLAPIFALLGIYTLRHGSRLSLPEYLLYAAASGVYCLVYLAASWLQFGTPLHFMEEGWILEDLLDNRWLIYPYAIVFSLLSLVPSLFAGLLAAFRPHAGRARQLVALAAMALVLAISMTTAVLHGTNPNPYRTVIVITTALLPFCFAFLWQSSPRPGAAADASARARGRPTLALVALALGLGWLAVSQGQVFARQRMEDPYVGVMGRTRGLPPHALALGTWLREELRGPPKVLTRKNLQHPIKLELTHIKYWQGWLAIAYLTGDPGRFDPSYWDSKEPTYLLEQELDRMKVGQLLLTNERVVDKRFRKVISVQDYHLLEKTRL